MWDSLLPIFGFLIGIVASMTGIGGGVFIVPLLTLLWSFDTRIAAGTSLTVIIFTATASTLNYAKQRRIYYRTGLILAVTTAPGAFLGAYLTNVLTSNTLGLIFGFFLILVALRMIIDRENLGLKRTKTEKEKPQSTVRSDTELVRSGRTIALGAGLSFFGGLASGLLGIGGGVLIVPIMTLALTMPIHLATATSMFTMIFSSISGVTEHYMANHINFESALFLALGTVLGAQVGAYTSRKISGKNLRRIFGIVLIIVSIQMILKYI
jgi:uncharacterized membrane protein YfcA